MCAIVRDSSWLCGFKIPNRGTAFRRPRFSFLELLLPFSCCCYGKKVRAGKRRFWSGIYMCSGKGAVRFPLAAQLLRWTADAMY